jgi:hypothetical protein
LFARLACPTHLAGLPEDDGHRADDYALLAYAQKSASDDSVSDEFVFAVIKLQDRTYYASLYAQAGTDEYEGYTLLKRSFALARGGAGTLEL